MSSLAVRNQFRTDIAAWLVANHPAVSFYDTINKDADPTEDIWCTVEFFPSVRERLTIGCNEIAEYGSADVLIFGRPGVGDSNVLTIADSLSMAFLNYNSNSIIVDNIDAPVEVFNGDAQHWYGVFVSLEYIRYS